MSAAWMFIQVVLGVLGSILVWLALASLVSDLRRRRRRS
ncbi:MAG: hypothetical protein QOC82_3336 [Frankiaceae bacterium]|jgi:hypothetical protein|nr:hypothetical protein [Frankiaceae bacterium]MDQ1698742.1 hypothetical protein [Frankiaceae bacterium]